MFHRLNRIALTAGVSVAVIAATAGPVSARTSADADPGSGPATTAGGLVTITGTITWKDIMPNIAPGGTGQETQTGTFTIDDISTSPRLTPNTQWTAGAASAYSATDTLDETTPNTLGCTEKTTGTRTVSGALPAQTTTQGEGEVQGAPLWATPSYPWMLYEIVIGHFSETQTQTVTGPPVCDPGTKTYSSYIGFEPFCSPAGAPPALQWLEEKFTGKDDVGTIPINCSQTVYGQTYSASGMLTATRKPAGLQITSPPDNSTIALTNSTYVTPQPGPADRAPKQRSLKVAGTTTCPGPVVISGVSVPVSGDAWNVEIPITAPGPVTLTAKAPGCGQVSNKVTLISLDITRPAENAQEPITGQPAMPDLNATLTVAGYPGDTSSVSFDWTLEARGETVTKPGDPDDWSGYAQTVATGSTTGTAEAWHPSYHHIVGGVGRLTVTASLPGVLGDPVTSDLRWINILGTGPEAAVAKSFVDQAEPQYATTIRHIICIESNWQQFSAAPDDNKGQPKIPDVPADWTFNPGLGQPLWGHPADIGIAQLSDPAASLISPDQYWNWQANLQAGIAVFNNKLQEAQAWTGSEQDRLADRLQLMLQHVNRNRQAKGLRPISMKVIPVPPLTDQQVTLQAIRLYNGGNEFHFDADYVLSKNNTTVDLVGTRKWVELPAGNWAQHAPKDLHLRVPWIPLAKKYQGYVQTVLHCKNS